MESIGTLRVMSGIHRYIESYEWNPLVHRGMSGIRKYIESYEWNP